MRTTSTEAILKLAVACVLVSALAGLAFLMGSQVHSVRGTSGAIGIMTGLTGSGVAAWFTVRARSPRLLLATVCSILPLGFWCWQIYRVVHV